MPSTFLTAEWRHLIMLNYVVEPDLLRPYVPAGTELDTWNDRTYVSVVGFLFLRTRLLGLPIPFHTNFEEINLRFYVRRKTATEWRRGVVFVKEIVPRRAIATVARVVYNENYVATRMRHAIDYARPGLPRSVAYEWRHGGVWNRIGIEVDGEPSPLDPRSEEEFITEHYWGYAAQRDGGTVEYQVEHPPWRVWSARSSTFDCRVDEVYGERFAPYLTAPPASAFLAEGSPIVVRRGVRM